MRIAITGASGFVGQQLLPLLEGAGAELLLVGRDPKALKRLFPSVQSCGYDLLADQAQGFDVLLHLAVLNNDAVVDDSLFFKVNVELALDVLARARKAGISRFVNVSSVHALDLDNTTTYAQSKRAAVEQLAHQTGIEVGTVYLPLVYGDHWGKNLAWLNGLPRPVATAIFTFLAAIKPTAHISRLANLVLSSQHRTGNYEVILVDDQDDNPVFTIGKRVVDLGFAFAVVLILWWLLVLTWLIVRLGSSGPAIFAQQRVGRDMKPFTCYKFRTMRQGTAQAGTHEISAAAVTPIGHFLRRTKIDELPQIWNIFRNEISLVGPRPGLPNQLELIEARAALGVFRLKPGISGLSQVLGIDMSDPDRLAKCDARYGALRCLLLEIKIALLTAFGRGRRDNVKAE